MTVADLMTSTYKHLDRMHLMHPGRLMHMLTVAFDSPVHVLSCFTSWIFDLLRLHTSESRAKPCGKVLLIDHWTSCTIVKFKI